MVNAGLEIDEAELAAILLNDSDQVDYIESLLADLVERGLIVQRDGHYSLPGHSAIPFRDDPLFAPIVRDIEQMQLPDNLPRTTEKARSLAKTAMLQRSQDFAASARSYLCACRLQWDAVDAGEPGATWRICAGISLPTRRSRRASSRRSTGTTPALAPTTWPSSPWFRKMTRSGAECAG